MPKTDLFFNKPLMNAAGTLGFYPDTRGPVDISGFGAFVTNPISKLPRTSAHGERFLPYPGGFLLHTGLPNPGLSQVIRRYGKRWARSPVPVIAHLLALRPASLAEMIERLEAIEGIMGVEIGLPPEIDIDSAMIFTESAVGELPIIVRLPMDQCEELAPAVMDIGASAVSLGAPRGRLPLSPCSPLPMGEGKPQQSEDGVRVTGRLYGPSIFPLALRAVEKLAQMEIPVIGAGGVYTPEEARVMMEAGALAIQIDAVLWRGGI
jgi:dihydroorotate dehydrogenase (NAD+) catalytic subunit